MYLKSIEVNSVDHFYLKKGFKIDNLRNINLLVGDQGCGKSSILRLLGTNRMLDVELTDIGKKGVNTKYFDFEADNPRTKDPELFTNPDGSSIGIGYGGALVSRFESHGEVLRDFSIKGLNNMENFIVIFDEPESGLSLRNQFNLIDAMNNAVNNNCQLIFSTHCLPIIQSQKEVYSMEHEKWMDSKDFLKTQK